jgi:hypothetical protein
VQTIPVCNEGLRWHVFKTPKTITADSMRKMRQWQGNSKSKESAELQIYHDNSRGTCELYGRSVLYHADPEVSRCPVSCDIFVDVVYLLVHSPHGAPACDLHLLDMLLNDAKTAQKRPTSANTLSGLV